MRGRFVMREETMDSWWEGGDKVLKASRLGAARDGGRCG